MSDNTAAIQCINKKGTSQSMECHHQVLRICKNHLSAAHIPGKLNTFADKDTSIKVFESGIKTFMFQTRNRSICYQY